MAVETHSTGPAAPPLRDRWQVIALRGGPHDGQTMRLPVDQTEVVLHDGPEPHRYCRVGIKPELHAESRLARLLGGRVRR